jgi:hypothetical protein
MRWGGSELGSCGGGGGELAQSAEGGELRETGGASHNLRNQKL